MQTFGVHILLVIELLLFATTTQLIPLTVHNNTQYGCSDDNVTLESITPLRVFQLNLDLFPRLRWFKVATYYKNQLKLLEKMTEQLLGHALFNATKSIMPSIASHFDAEYFEEMEGFAKHADLPTSSIVAYNIVYEILTFCSSIIGKVDQTGELIHGRNLDFGSFVGQNIDLFPDKLTNLIRDMTFNVEWVKNGKVIAQSTQFAGHIGIHTAIKTGHFSFSTNSRFVAGESGISGIFRKILFKTNAEFVTLMSRKLILSNSNYEQAEKYLMSKQLVAPVYFMIASATGKKGALITRGINTQLFPEYINNNSFLFQTNYDFWKNTPIFDHRRVIGIQCIGYHRKKTKNHNELSTAILNVLNTRPLLNKNTMFTTLMLPQRDQFVSYVQKCIEDCTLF